MTKQSVNVIVLKVYKNKQLYVATPTASQNWLRVDEKNS